MRTIIAYFLLAIFQMRQIASQSMRSFSGIWNLVASSNSNSVLCCVPYELNIRYTSENINSDSVFKVDLSFNETDSPCSILAIKDRTVSASPPTYNHINLFSSSSNINDTASLIGTSANGEVPVGSQISYASSNYFSTDHSQECTASFKKTANSSIHYQITLPLFLSIVFMLFLI